MRISSERIFIIFLLLFTAFPLTAANGIKAIPETYAVNKTVGIGANFTLQIHNQEPFAFFNITLEDNPYVTMPKIATLGSGQAINITATAISDTNFNQTIRIRGVYAAALGSSAKTVHVNVTAFKSTPCDFTITKGDKVIWTSFLLNDIIMVNANTALPVDGATLKHNKTYERSFSAPESFRYYFSMSGFQFPEICTVTVLDDSGFVNDPQLDGFITVRNTVNFDPTNLSLSVPISAYSMNFFETQDGVLTLTNTGAKIAKSVSLSGSWISFSKNAFDLQPGETRAVSYTIIPIVTATNQTNTTYSKSIEAKGNFPTLAANLNVFVKYAVIGDNASDVQQIQDVLDEFCARYPKSRFCDPDPETIYRTVGNGSSQEFNISVTSEQWRTFLLSALEEKEIQQTQSNFLRERIDEMSTRNNITYAEILSLQAAVQSFSAKQEETDESSYQRWMSAVILMIIAISGALIYRYKKSGLQERLRMA